MNKLISISVVLASLLLAGCSSSFDSLDMYSRPTLAPVGVSVTMSENISSNRLQDPRELVPSYGDQSLYDGGGQDSSDNSLPIGEEQVGDNGDASHEAVVCAPEGQNLTQEELSIASVDYQSDEAPGTLVIHTSECAAYYLLGDGKAARVRVAVGKEGFEWSGTAYVREKRINPTWTPPSEMIARRPELAKWAKGMPGGISQNPLGTRALYLYDEQGNDTMYRIHGTTEPQSIGHRASSGCIRVYPGQIEALFDRMPIGNKVIVTS